MLTKPSPMEIALAEYRKRFGHTVPGIAYRMDRQTLLLRLQHALREDKPIPEFESYQPTRGSVDEVPTGLTSRYE